MGYENQQVKTKTTATAGIFFIAVGVPESKQAGNNTT
jgi:hypothetical protein